MWVYCVIHVGKDGPLAAFFMNMICVLSGGNSDLIAGFADFSSPAASASLPNSTGRLCFLLSLYLDFLIADF